MDQVKFDGMTIPEIIEQKIGKAVPEAEKVNITDAKSLGDAIAFQQLIDAVFRELNREWKRCLDDLTDATGILDDKIKHYRAKSPTRKGPGGEERSTARFRDTHPKRRKQEEEETLIHSLTRADLEDSPVVITDDDLPDNFFEDDTDVLFAGPEKKGNPFDDL